MIFLIRSTPKIASIMKEYGKQIMNERFLLNSSHTFLNHGSFGTAGKEPFQFRLDLLKKMEDQPDVWFRQNIRSMWDTNVAAVSEFLGSKKENLVFVDNTTTGINCVLRSLEWKPGDEILINSWTYEAVKNIVKFVAHTKGVIVRYVPFPYPLKYCQEVIDLYENMLRKHPNIKLVILDYISSMPPALMPLNDLIKVCRQFDKLVVVDGAHAPGQMLLNLENLGCDFFSGNLHKWCYAPRGCAVLWVDPKFHSKVFPSIISKLNLEGKLSEMFYYQGTADDTTFYTSEKTIEFYNSIGGFELINNYSKSLVEQGANLLVEQLQTEHFPLPQEMKAPCMRLVRIPILKKYTLPKTDAVDVFVRDLPELMADMWEKFKIQGCFVTILGKPWVRISANVYNTLEDYQKLVDAILVLAKEDESCG